MTYNSKERKCLGIRGTPDNWLSDIKYTLNHPEEEDFELKYSLTFSGEKVYTLKDLNKFIDHVHWKYIYSEDDQNTEDSCPHCRYGSRIWYIAFLKDGNYAFIDLWDGCASYDANGSIIFSNSLEDIKYMCMDDIQREQYINYKMSL
jgi:hypothetical protein